MYKLIEKNPNLTIFAIIVSIFAFSLVLAYTLPPETVREYNPVNIVEYLLANHPVLTGFVITFISCNFALSHSSNEFFLENTSISLIIACVVAMLCLTMSVTSHIPSDEQRYECRTSGGSLEFFGERGWVCIKPTNKS